MKEICCKATKPHIKEMLPLAVLLLRDKSLTSEPAENMFEEMLHFGWSHGMSRDSDIMFAKLLEGSGIYYMHLF